MPIDEDLRSGRLTALESENQRLQRAVEELSLLNDLARVIGGSLNTSEIMNTIINRSVRVVGAQQGTITLLKSDHQAANKTLVRAMASTAGGAFHLTEALLGWMQLNKTPLAISAAAGDARFRGVAWDAEVLSIACVPLMIKGNLIGILAVYNKKNQTSFDDDDQRILAIIASQSAQIIESARLFEEETALTRMREQVRLAAEVQQHLLPELPAIDGYDIAGTSVAAQVIGGDYFDFIPMPNGKFGICLGDVSGKGLPASLVMSNVQAIIRVLAMLDTPPGESLRLANTLLHRCTSPEKFVTFFFSILDPGNGVLQFCNAGHNPPLYISEGGCRRLEGRGIVLGILDHYNYVQSSVTMKKDDVLVIFSDGISEAVNALDEELGEEDLIRVVESNHTGSAAQIQAAVLDAVRHHANGIAQYDDITIVVVKRVGSGVVESRPMRDLRS